MTNHRSAPQTLHDPGPPPHFAVAVGRHACAAPRCRPVAGPAGRGRRATCRAAPGRRVPRAPPAGVPAETGGLLNGLDGVVSLWMPSLGRCFSAREGWAIAVTIALLPCTHTPTMRPATPPPSRSLFFPQVAVGVEGISPSEGGGLELDEEEGGGEASSRCPGWHEAYYGLLLLEKVAAASPAALAWPSSSEPAAAVTANGAAAVTPGGSGGSNPHAGALWDAALALLPHRHAWVRKAAARLAGACLASSGAVTAGLWDAPGRAGRLAFSLFAQLECEQADEATCKQAARCLLLVAARMYEDEVAAAGGPEAHAAAVAAAAAAAAAAKATKGAAAVPNGTGEQGRGQKRQPEDDEEDGEEEDREEEEDAEGSGSEDGEEGAEEEAGAGEGSEEAGEEAEGGAGQAAGEEQEGGEEDGEGAGEERGDDGGRDVDMSAQVSARAFTLRGLVRRMARLAVGELARASSLILNVCFLSLDCLWALAPERIVAAFASSPSTSFSAQPPKSTCSAILTLTLRAAPDAPSPTLHRTTAGMPGHSSGWPPSSGSQPWPASWEVGSLESAGAGRVRDALAWYKGLAGGMRKKLYQQEEYVHLPAL